MNKRFFQIAFSVLFALMLSLGCTEQQKVKKVGGTGTKTLPPGMKLVNVSWKENNMWILTRPMRPGEVPEEYKFSESSDYGILEGTMVIKEEAKK
jgi:hypothetical protein